MTEDICKIDEFIKRHSERKVVAIQGLGFVGSAMLAAIAGAKNKNGLAPYAVIGVDLPIESASWKIKAVNEGRLPVESEDDHLVRVFEEAFSSGNIIATANKYAYSVADIVVVSTSLNTENDESKLSSEKGILLEDFISAMREIAENVNPFSLIVIESTLPPGLCKKLLVPLFKSEFTKRGHGGKEIKLAYSYERVTPGKNYLKSIISYHRIFSAINDSARKEARDFMESIIDTDSYPLTEFYDITAAELAKVLENSYRATNIALIQEWTEFAESTGVNLFEVIEGIKKRDTHKNIMQPGFGVGGNCLTKDPILADWSKRELFGCNNHLGMALEALNINYRMPLHSLTLLNRYLKGIEGKKILLMGVSYINDVNDTRSSPSELFYKKCVEKGACVVPHDPIVKYWRELKITVLNNLKEVEHDKVDAIVLAVRHDEYVQMSPEQYKNILKPGGLILDSHNIINDKKAASLRKLHFKLAGVGKGHWNKLLKD